ncbi:MAG: hypothetical protein QOJ35_2425 [Solirubrobacteraceae bacterium]|jgi:hypothetical protein|nr:hypothetical protein [Solirubrobacteraceae bacterium]
MLEWKSLDHAREIGRQADLDALEAAQDEVATWSS